MNSHPESLGIDWTKKETLYFVSECYDRDANLRLLLGYSTGYLKNAMILILGKSIFQPYMNRDWKVSDTLLKSTRVERNEMPTSGGVWEGKLFSVLLDTLGLETPKELGVVPIPIGKRVSILILGEPIEGRSLGDLHALARVVGTQLEKLILLTKKNELPPIGSRIPAPPIRKRSSSVSNDSLEAHVLEATSEVEEAIASEASEPETTEAPEPETTEAPSAFDEAEKSHPRLDKKEVEEFVIRQTLTLESEVGLIAPNINEENDDERQSPFQEASENISEAEKESSKTSFGLPLLGESAQQQPISASIGHLESADSTSFGLPLFVQSSEIYDDSSVASNLGGDSSDIRITLSQRDQNQDDISRVPTMNAKMNEATEVDPNTFSDAQKTLEREHKKGFAREETSGVSIMIPKQIGEESASHATLLGGIGVAADMVEKSLRETAANRAIKNGDLKRNIPGAAIFRARKRSGKVGDFIPRATQKKKSIAADESSSKVKTQKFQIKEESFSEKKSTRKTLHLEPTEPVRLPAREATKEVLRESTLPMDQGLQSDTNPNIPPKIQKNHPAYKDDWNLRDTDVLDPSVFDGLSDASQFSIEARSIIIKSGPSVVENQEYFLMIDSRNKKVAFEAAQHIADIGKPALPFLGSIFPGRIFIDRYQYTAETLPNAASHTPVLNCIVNIGQAAMDIPFEYLEDKSTETRFYAVFSLLNFDCGDRLGEIYERFFDKDPQIQQVAKFVLRQNKGTRGFIDLVDRLRNEIQFSLKDHRLEIACQLLSAIKDRQSVELLINLLEERDGHTKTTIHRALQNLTLKDLSSPYEWRQWWKDAHEEPRSTWLVAALDSNDEMIRKSAYDEIQMIPGLMLNYHALQPSKLRRRAQRELRSWFDTHGA